MTATDACYVPEFREREIVDVLRRRVEHRSPSRKVDSI